MSQEIMHKGIPFSPTTTLSANISATDTSIPVDDVNAFPDAPNYATIGTDAGAETIAYSSKTSTTLGGCTRGIEGTAKEWQTDEIIGRNFTAKDHESLINNIEDIAENKLDKKFKVEVTNASDITVKGKALDATQNNPDIQGSLANKISILKDSPNFEGTPKIQGNAIASCTRTTITDYLNGWASWANIYNLHIDKIGNRVMCNGILAPGIKSTGTPICVFPDGFRPLKMQVSFILGNRGSSQSVTIGTDGSLRVDTSAGTPWGTAPDTLYYFDLSWGV